MEQIAAAMVACLMIAAPVVVAQEDDGETPEESTWGLCQAKQASQPGNQASNGTVNQTPPFSNVSEEDCQEADHPSNQTFGPDDHPDDEDHPGQNESEEHPDDEDHPGGQP